MDSDELDPTSAERDLSWSELAKRKLRRRWVQVALVMVIGLLLMGLSALILAPKRAVREKEPNFLYCPKCEAESRYDQKFEGEPCTKCSDDPVGVLVGRANSIKDTGAKKSPWKWVYLAVSLEALVSVSSIVYLLSRTHVDPSSTYYVFSCPHCGQRLRFRHVALNGLGQCSRCKRPVRFPGEDGAVLESDLIREEEARRAAEEADDEDDD